MLERDGDEVVAWERHVAGQELEQDAAERIDVALGPDALAARLLGRDVVRRSHHCARLGDAALDVERPRDPEVGHLRAAVAVQEDVLRLHVAVDDAALVREREPARDRQPEVDDLVDRERAALRDHLLQVVAVDVLEDDELSVTFLAAVDDRDDVRVRHLSDCPGLAEEALHVLGVLAVARVQDLERDLALEEHVARAPPSTCRPAPTTSSSS